MFGNIALYFRSTDGKTEFADNIKDVVRLWIEEAYGLFSCKVQEGKS